MWQSIHHHGTTNLYNNNNTTTTTMSDDINHAEIRVDDCSSLGPENGGKVFAFSLVVDFGDEPFTPPRTPNNGIQDELMKDGSVDRIRIVGKGLNS